MKLINIIFICFLIYSCSSGSVSFENSLELNGEDNNMTDILAAVYLETKTEFRDYVKIQKKIRGKLSKFIEEEDLEKISKLRIFYMRGINLNKEYLHKELKAKTGNKSSLYFELHILEKHENQISCTTERIMPLLHNNPDYVKLTKYLCEKYQKELFQANNELQPHYQKLKIKETEIYNKYVPKKLQFPLNEKMPNSSGLSDYLNEFACFRILIIDPM